jgi:hypothetical protein
VESPLPLHHAVGMTYQWDNEEPGTNAMLIEGPADWISPHSTLQVAPPFDYRSNPPLAFGNKVIVTDTDHLWGIGGDASWVWKSFTRGHNPIFMDPWDDPVHGKAMNDALLGTRAALGHAAAYARRLDLGRVMPRTDVSSTGYCLTDGESQYVVYQPERGGFTVWAHPGRYRREWFRLDTASVVEEEELVATDEPTYVVPPFDGPGVLLLWRS